MKKNPGWCTFADTFPFTAFPGQCSSSEEDGEMLVHIKPEVDEDRGCLLCDTLPEILGDMGLSLFLWGGKKGVNKENTVVLNAL